MDEREWDHKMFTARQSARRRNEHMHVVGQRWSYAGRSGWHYVVVDSASAARVRSFRDRGLNANGVAK